MAASDPDHGRADAHRHATRCRRLALLLGWQRLAASRPCRTVCGDAYGRAARRRGIQRRPILATVRSRSAWRCNAGRRSRRRGGLYLVRLGLDASRGTTHPLDAKRGIAGCRRLPTGTGRRGSLRGEAGPSVATPYGVLDGVAMFNWTGSAWAAT